jgi:leucyl aminopeptidase
MKLHVRNAPQVPARQALLVLLCAEGTAPARVPGLRLPPAALADFKGDAREARACDPLGADGKQAGRVLLLGLGRATDIDPERLRRAAAQAVRFAEAHKRRSVCIAWPAGLERGALSEAAAGQALAEGALMGAYAFTRCKSKPPQRHLAAIELAAAGARFRQGAERGRVLAEANLYARDLQNAPPNLMTPRHLAEAARKLTRSSPRLRCKVLDEPALERLGMGLLLSVSKGSHEPARLIHLTYTPRGRSRGVVAFVGKGLTFDAGGISLKPAAKMDEMKFDMSGGAAVLGAFRALAELDVPYEVHGIVAASENLPDGRANKPGDVITAMNGLTVEILNTDAEGRLVLADALHYALTKVKPDTVIDLATLTGAVVVALGHELSGLFASTDKLREELLAAGAACGEALWALPLLDHQKDQMKSQFADLRNINDPGHGGGASSGAAFLANFVGGTEWAHLDIAGTAWGGLPREWVGGPGGSGVGVRLLLEYLERRK